MSRTHLARPGSAAAHDEPGTPADEGEQPPVLRAEVLVKRYGRLAAVEDLSLGVARGELLTIVGPSGCGKSTLLRLIAGLTSLDAGRITVAGRTVVGPSTWVPAERRDVGMVFQDQALFPHLTVADNVAFGLGRRNPRRDARVTEVLELVGLASMAERYPHELSGGEAQRVALARALAPAPAVVLLDEPFSNLDRNLRTRIREDVVTVLRTVGATGVFVTHDQEEALAVGDRVAVMRAGRLEQVAEPPRVFHAPSSRFVATFMGEADFLAGRQVGTAATTRFGDVAVDGEPGLTRDVEVMIRPHEVGWVTDAAGEAVVSKAEFQGAFVFYHLELENGEVVRSLRAHTETVPVGTRVAVRLEPGHPLAVFPRSPSA